AVFYIKITGGRCGLQHKGLDFLSSTKSCQILFRQGCYIFQFLGKTQHSPSQSTGPGGKPGVTLLGPWISEITVIGVEYAFVGGSAPYVIAVAAFAIKN